jgi:hypothetical protein
VSLTVSLCFGREKEGKHKEEGRRGSGNRREKEKEEERKKGGIRASLSSHSLSLSLCYQHEREEKKIRKDGGIWVCENQRVGAMFYRKGREANILQTCISSFRNLSYVIFNLS